VHIIVLNFANVNLALAMRDEQSVSPITPKRLMMVLKCKQRWMHRDRSIHIEIAWVRQNTVILCCIMSFLDFYSISYNIIH
jgi:hypothetical protein